MQGWIGLLLPMTRGLIASATKSTNALTPSVQGGGRAPRCRVFRAVQCGELKQTVGSLHTLASQRSTSLTQ